MRSMRWFVAAALTATVIFSGCGGGDDDDGGGGGGGFGLLTGAIKDVNGSVVAGVSVSISGLTPAVNNEQGWFSIADVPAGNNTLVEFKKTGYVTTYRRVDINDGGNTYIDVSMSAVGTQQNITGAAGGTVTHSGTSVAIPANSIVDANKNPFSGTVVARVTAFDPTVEAQLLAFPGEFEGLSLAGETVPIMSYGFVDVTLSDESGNPLQLADGKTATITGAIPAGLQATAPATIGMWYFNSTMGRWEEAGTATKNGNNYVGTVSHFTVWNWDVPFPAAWIKGVVVDGDGNPIQGASVTAKGPNWRSGESYTPADGTFRIPAAAGSTFSIWAQKGTAKSATLSNTAPAANQELDVGQLVIGEGSVKILATLTWGAHPSDLDSHLLSPNGDHLYYRRMSVNGAKLDTDDRSSYGPEVVSVARLQNGTYKYLVRHYAGEGTISSSEATVTMIANEANLYTLRPPAGAPNNGIWHLWNIVVENGSVTSVETVNAYVANSALPANEL